MLSERLPVYIRGLSFEVGNSTPEQCSIILELTYPSVTRHAEVTTHYAGLMAVIHCEVTASINATAYLASVCILTQLPPYGKRYAIQPSWLIEVYGLNLMLQDTTKALI